MNNKVYRLLRNNKEQGPFTATELIQKNLKSFDLVWVDGRSAAWSYPVELAEFKMYVEEPAEKPTINVIKKQDEVIPSGAAIKTMAVTNNTSTAETPKQKPRYKVSAAWSRIQTVTAPLYNNVMVAEPKKISAAKIIDIHKTQPATSKALSWEQAWRDWEDEKKTVAPLKHSILQPLSVGKETGIKQPKVSTPMLEKKFEQSLDSIAHNYIDNILQQKKKSKSFQLGKASEFILPSLALIIIFSIAYWFMHDTKVTALPAAAPATQPAANTIKDEKTSLNTTNSTVVNNQNATTKANDNIIKNVNINETPAKQTLNKNYVAETTFTTVKTTKPLNNIVVEKKAAANALNNIDIDLKKNTKPAAKQFDSATINNIPKDNAYNDAPVNNTDLNAAENRPVRRRTNTNATNNLSSDQNVSHAPVTKNINEHAELNYVSIPEYVSLDDGNGSIKIQNISDVDLDLAVIDVQYFDASGRFHKGETLYLHNLKAGKAVTIKTSKDANSAYAIPKIALVSSDANGIYAVGDN